MMNIFNKLRITYVVILYKLSSWHLLMNYDTMFEKVAQMFLCNLQDTNMNFKQINNVS